MRRSRQAALTPRVAVVKRFRRDNDLTSPAFLFGFPEQLVLVESPHRDTCSQAAQAQSRPPARSLLQATPKTRPRTGPLPPPTFPLRGRLGTPPAFGGFPHHAFVPHRRTRRDCQSPHGRANPLRTSRIQELRQKCREPIRQLCRDCGGPKATAERHAAPVSASPGALAEGATHVAAIATQGA